MMKKLTTFYATLPKRFASATIALIFGLLVGLAFVSCIAAIAIMGTAPLVPITDITFVGYVTSPFWYFLLQFGLVMWFFVGGVEAVHVFVRPPKHPAGVIELMLGPPMLRDYVRTGDTYEKWRARIY
jgi:hypothetical protein